MKSVWMTTIGSESSAESIKKLVIDLKKYGINIAGHFWEDDLEKYAWIKPRSELSDKKVSAWIISGTNDDFSKPSIRYGLSMLAITVKALRGANFPIIIVQTGNGLLSQASLPTILADVEVFSISTPGIGAKLVAKLHQSRPKPSAEFRFDTYGISQIGQWFEIGPLVNAWKGAMFAVSAGEIRFHAVGAKGKLPERCILNYPVKGIKMEITDIEYTAWAVQNELDTDTSYYIKVEGMPGSVAFGSYADEDEAELYMFHLQ